MSYYEQDKLYSLQNVKKIITNPFNSITSFMETVVAILCMTFLLVLVAFWIMPTKKMKAVSKELKSLFQVLPISAIIKSFKKENEVNPP